MYRHFAHCVLPLKCLSDCSQLLSLCLFCYLPLSFFFFFFLCDRQSSAFVFLSPCSDSCWIFGEQAQDAGRCCLPLQIVQPWQLFLSACQAVHIQFYCTATSICDFYGEFNIWILALLVFTTTAHTHYSNENVIIHNYSSLGEHCSITAIDDVNRSMSLPF